MLGRLLSVPVDVGERAVGRDRRSGPGNSGGRWARRGLPGRLGVTPLGGSPGATRSMPSRPLAEDAVGEDAVAGSRLDQNAGLTWKAIVLPRPAVMPPIVLLTGGIADDDAVDLVAQAGGAREVGADVVALDEVARGPCAVELDAPVVGRDQVAAGGRGCRRSCCRLRR